MSGGKTRQLRFLLAGGGSGGHIYPALDIGAELLKRYPYARLLYVGGKRGLEGNLIPREGHDFAAITVAGFERKLSLGTLVTAAKAGIGFIQSMAIVARFRPDVAVGTGGYASGPAILAASFAGVPVLIHEQNVVPGATNRLLARRAQVVAISWEESKQYLPDPGRAVLTGNPIRSGVTKASRQDGCGEFGFDPSRPIVLATGGSQGALNINTAVIGSMPALVQRGAQFLLATGLDKFDSATQLAQEAGLRLSVDSHGIARSSGGDVIIMPYIYNMPLAQACADLMVARSGAITLAEIAARGIPSVLIPHPKVPDNVQERNARALEARGAAVVVLDRDLNAELLTSVVGQLLDDRHRRAAMSVEVSKVGIPDAASRVVKCVESLIG